METRIIGLAELGRLDEIPAMATWDPPAWLAAGRQQTASGYGSRLNSGYTVKHNGRTYRIYTVCWSNCGTSYITTKTGRLYVRWY